LDDTAQTLSYEHYYPYGGTAIIAGKDKTQVQQKRKTSCRIFLIVVKSIEDIFLSIVVCFSVSDFSAIMSLTPPTAPSSIWWHSHYRG
jgi:hypothetical protein